jgi:uncharacterized protein YegJ (DUF2314 family)
MKPEYEVGITLTAVVATLLACQAWSADRQERSELQEPARVVEPPGRIERGEPWPAGNLVAQRFAFRLAVYHLPRPKTNVETTLAGLLAGKPVRRLAKLPEGEVTDPVVVVGQPSIDDYAPPDHLEHFARGLSNEQQRHLKDTQEVTTLTFLGPGAQAIATYRVAIGLVAALARATGGLPWDEETREVFTLDTWSQRVQAWDGDVPDMPRHVTVHMYPDGELHRLVTLGMAKFALPDVAVNQVSKANSDSMLSLINLTCQTFVERKQVAHAGRLSVALDTVKNDAFRQRSLESLETGARRRGTLLVSKVEPEEGDADNRLAELVFPGPRSSLQTRHLETITAVYGSSEDIVYVKHDQQLEAASKQARDRLMKRKAHFEQGPPLGEELLVKAPFQTPDGGTEWMWVELVSWRGKVIHGILQNDPFDIPDLKAGARVEVAEDAIFDYIWRKADGTTEGNRTSALLKGRRDE